MGLFSKDKKDNELKIVKRDDYDDKYKKKGYEKIDENDYVVANPKLYKREDGTIFGGYMVNENVMTLLPKKLTYQINNVDVKEYKLYFNSTTKNGIIGERDYLKSIRAMQDYTISESDDWLLVSFNLKEMNKFFKSVK